MHRLSISRALALAIALSAASHATAQQVELLDFTSKSCPACVQMEPVLRELAASGAPIRRVDINRERDLAGKFRVEYLPTFVVTANGREIDRHVGATSPDHLRQMLERAHAAAAQTEPTARGQSPDPAPKGARAVTAQPVASSSPGGEARDDDLVAASVRLRIEDPQGISYGTGTIIAADGGEALILTCGHLFRESQGKLPVQVELFEPNAAAPQVADVVEGEVISYDLVRDLGLVRIHPEGRVRATPVAARGTTFEAGEKVASVGCDHGKQPTVWRTRLTAVNRYVGPANVEAAGTPVQGRSGGGLFSEGGELIGVCFAADEKGNEGLYVGLPAIYEELDRLDIASSAASIGATPPANTAQEPQIAAVGVSNPGPGVDRAAASQTAAPPQAHDGVVSGPSPSPGRLVPVTPADATPAKTASLSAEEQAALEEIAQRSRGGEVIVIIRPKSPGDPCEIFSLDNPSSEFLNQLTAVGSKATHPRFTTHKAATTKTQHPVARQVAAPRQTTQNRRGIEGWAPVKR